MDEIDRKILGMLQRDGSTPYAELGLSVGLSASAINDRLKRLKAKGALKRISAEVAPEALDLTCLVFVLVELGELRCEPAFLAAMRAAPEVLECHHVAGDYSYILKVRLSGMSHLERFLSTRIKSLEGIRRTHSLITLSSVKETHELDTGIETPKPGAGA
jgi:Lrp/AsnC family leucine-responsive transcriptional regulator